VLGTPWEIFTAKDCDSDTRAAALLNRDLPFPTGFWEQPIPSISAANDPDAAFGCALWKADGTAAATCDQDDDTKWRAMITEIENQSRLAAGATTNPDGGFQCMCGEGGIGRYISSATGGTPSQTTLNSPGDGCSAIAGMQQPQAGSCAGPNFLAMSQPMIVGTQYAAQRVAQDPSLKERADNILSHLRGVCTPRCLKWCGGADGCLGLCPRSDFYCSAVCGNLGIQDSPISPLGISGNMAFLLQMYAVIDCYWQGCDPANQEALNNTAVKAYLKRMGITVSPGKGPCKPGNPSIAGRTLVEKMWTETKDWFKNVFDKIRYGPSHQCKKNEQTFLPYQCWDARNQCQVILFCVGKTTDSGGVKRGPLACVPLNCDPTGHQQCAGTRHSCFVPSARVTMADGSRRCIVDVRSGDLVMSGRTGGSTRVVYVDEQFGGRHIWGFGGRTPFATVDHSFMAPEGDRRLVLHPDLAKRNRWYQDLEALVPGSGAALRTRSSAGAVGIERLGTDAVMARMGDGTSVIDLVTEDHSYVVEGLAVHDDMPEVERNPIAALLCRTAVQFMMTGDQNHLFAAGGRSEQELVQDASLDARARRMHLGWQMMQATGAITKRILTEESLLHPLDLWDGEEDTDEDVDAYDGSVPNGVPGKPGFDEWPCEEKA